MNIEISEMKEEDFPAVKEIEHLAFPGSWPADVFWSELFCNDLSHYCVARAGGRVVGYGGVWLVLDEAHITTMAVHPEYRRFGIGSKVLFWLLDQAACKGMSRATLEVRESNLAARKLYESFGFEAVGVRKNYYLDDSEDAVIMWTQELSSEEQQARLGRLREKLSASFFRPGSRLERKWAPSSS
ncbi:MAG: ribosomal protein S18-alanine N-acetyltransferase [Armatimonadetes bacterium]|nr:ribosomal protein S18-alanine N-acetyltransferase [Armatimonadota bacterium]